MDLELRRDPERLLEQIEEEERRKKRGRLKIFLGYASGVGKSVKMLAEGLRRRERGDDVVVGAVQPKSSPEIDRLVARYEVIPTLKIRNRDVIDIERLLRRHPQVVVIDGLAYTNPPGNRHPERWQEIEELLNAGISVMTSVNMHYVRELQDEVAAITGKRPVEIVPLNLLKNADDIEVVDAPWEDVMVLLDAGIDVLTTMNLQHLESLNDQIWQISGIRVRETVPDWVLKQAEEVVMVDVTPEALINRLRRGVVYETEKANRALENFFKEQTLVALRELALRQAAHEVEVRAEEERPTDRILIHVTDEPTTAMLIRRVSRVPAYLLTACF